MHQLENGYTRIANTLLEQFSKTPLSGAGFRILLWVFRNSYGYQRKRTNPVTIRGLAKEINMPGIGAVQLAIQVLIDNGLLKKTDDGGYELDKNGISAVSVPEMVHLKVFPKQNTSVPKMVQSVPKTEQAECNIIKENSKETKRKEDFNVFWRSYPHKSGKKAAFTSWCKLNPPLDTCLATLEWQKKSDRWTKDGGQYIPLPATWLNQGRWEDVPSTHKVVVCSVCGKEGVLPKATNGTPMCRKCKEEAVAGQNTGVQR